MNEHASQEAFGVLTEPATLKIQRLLPGPVERIWAHLTESDLRRQWLAAGRMEMKAGAPFEFVWRNDELTNPPGERPPGFSVEHRMKSRITELDPPHRLGFAWESSGDVTIELTPQGDDVMLTLIHRRLPNRRTMVGVSAGWHAHLDLLVVHATGRQAPPFWGSVARLREDYERRIPADPI